MCGRFTLRTPAKDIGRFFQLAEMPEFRPRYNIAPSQSIATIRMAPNRVDREVAMLHWGLIPSWADDPKIAYRMINARAETVASKPSFRQAFARRRCLIVTDGFYEWQKTSGAKQPFLIHMKDDGPFALAGLWECWKREDREIQSCAIIVTEANDVLKPIHDRMPVILSPLDYEAWLDPGLKDKQALQALLRPYPPEAMEAFPVSTIVNNPRNDAASCVERVKCDPSS